MSDDSKKIDAEDLQETESEQNSDGLIIEDPDILASLKQLSDAVTDDSNPETTQIQTPESIKNIVEGAIMAASKAISLDKILTLFPEKENVDKNAIRQSVEQLMQDYQSRGIELIEVSSGFRFQVAQTVAPWASRLWEERPQKYSRALLETLALVAYRQPVTRGEIEEIRGVSVSSQIMRTLVERDWVRVIGHRDVPGKPAMYATTKTFLDYFGLKKLDELPTLSEIRDLDAIDAELDFGDNKQDSSDQDSKDQEGQKDQEDFIQDNIDQNSAEKNAPSDLKITLPIDSQQDENLMIKKDESGEEADGAISNGENLSSERIDIDAELSALKETYQQIDAIDKKNEEQEPLQTTSDEKSFSVMPIDIGAELNALKETHQQANTIDKKEAEQDSEDDVKK